MTSPASRFLPAILVLSCASPLFGHDGAHGGGDDTTKFNTADLDATNSLTPDEFAGVYPPKVKPAVVLKKFAGLDDNDDGLLTRDEWNPGNRAAF